MVGPEVVRRITPRPTSPGAALRDAWAGRRLVVYFGRRFNEKRYLRTFLGPLWLLLRPVLAICPQLFVFAVIVPPPAGPVPYVLVFLTGFATWNLFAESCYWATRSLELNRKLLRAVPVPPLLMLAGAVAPAVIDTLTTLTFLALAVLLYVALDGQLYLDPSLATLLIVPAVLALVLLGLGVALFLAGPATTARDVRFGLRFALSAWYFFTPIVYSLAQVPASIRSLVELNPATAPVQAIRRGLLGSGESSTLAVASTTVCVLALVVIGLVVFTRAEPRARKRL
ncbi:MAG: ABC transporter permease [Solirubrobacteraceae bacterium]